METGTTFRGPSKGLEELANPKQQQTPLHCYLIKILYRQRIKKDTMIYHGDVVMKLIEEDTRYNATDGHMETWKHGNKDDGNRGMIIHFHVFTEYVLQTEVIAM